MGCTRIFRVWWTVCAAALACLTTGAQSIQREVWTTENGLPQNSVHAMLQAKDGYVWLATENGVARFDGLRFERFGTETESAFSSNDACCLVQTADGAVWIGTSGGLVRFQDSHFSRVLGTSATLGIVADDSTSVLLLTAAGLLRARGENSEAMALPGGAEATAIGKGSSGSVLIAAGTQLYRSLGGQFREERSLPAAPVELLEDKAGRLWFRTASEVIERVGTTDRHWALGKELPGSRLESISVTEDGLVAGTNRGAFLLPDTPDRAAVQPVTELANTAVLSAMVDTEGDRWFGTDSSGVCMLRRRAIGSIEQLQNETVTAVVSTSSGNHWVGTRDSGLRMLRSGAVTTPAVNKRLSSQVILALAPAAAGDVWTGTPEGLDQLEASRVTHYGAADGLPDDLVRSVLADPDGSVWVGTRRGLAHLQAGHVSQVLTMADGLPSDVIGSMLLTRNGDLWIGTLGGLARLHDRKLDRITLPADSASRAVTALVELRDGAIIVGTRSSGVFVLSPTASGRPKPVRSSRLPMVVDALLLDDRGDLWIRNPLGVARASAEAVEHCAEDDQHTLQVRQYGTPDGMPSVDASSDGHPSAWRDNSGVLWFATRRGLAMLDPAQLPVDRVAPPIAIERFLVDNAVMATTRDATLAASSRRFVIEYAGLSFAAPAQIAYRFRLEGFDREWIDAGNRRSAEYTNLPAGSYRFLVEARNADGTVSSTPAELRFRVAAPFYRRWWFYLILLVLAGLLTYALYRLRLRRVQREFAAVLQERNRIAREIHDTLAQDFVAVSLQLEVTSQLLRANATAAAQEQVDAARTLVRDGIREARESIWALRANTASDSLPARLSALVQRTDATPATAQCLVKGAYRALATATEQEILRIAKEALGNAIRHAVARRIVVSLHYLEDAVEFAVRDDGRGFRVAEGSARVGHYGLQGMRERAASFGGQLEIQSAPGQGSTVSIRVSSSRK